MTSLVINSKPPGELLERLYSIYNKREFVSPDPLQFLYEYSDERDIEIVAFLASGLAYGRVAQILKSVSLLLEPMKDSPYDFIMNTPESDFDKIYRTFKHRFNDGSDIANLLRGLRTTLREYDTLENAFISGLKDDDLNVCEASSAFSIHLTRHFPRKESFLISNPSKGSACKRLFLALRWLVRQDDVDLGIWKKLSPSKLIVPLDTHMFSTASKMGFTSRSSADIKAACEVTSSFASYVPDDPVKYDFALTRFGIHPEVRRNGGKI